VQLFELVPNLSEGRNDETIDRAVAAVEATGARVLDRSSDAAHNRSVLTIVGDADRLVGAALALAHVARERIDLRAHNGLHPRIGALDVLPFVPLGDAPMAAAVELARNAARGIWEREGIPSFLYGEAALLPERRLLANARRDGFEGLAARFARNDRPDIGDIAAHPSAGAIAIGAREMLVAWNIELQSEDLAAGKAIAAELRERGGGLPGIRALAFRLADGRVQLSFNITNYRATSPMQLRRSAEAAAVKRGLTLGNGELIGLIPRDALDDAIAEFFALDKDSSAAPSTPQAPHSER